MRRSWLSRQLISAGRISRSWEMSYLLFTGKIEFLKKKRAKKETADYIQAMEEWHCIFGSVGGGGGGGGGVW